MNFPFYAPFFFSPVCPNSRQPQPRNNQAQGQTRTGTPFTGIFRRFTEFNRNLAYKTM